MSHVVIQVPCFNEEETLALTLSQLPKSLPGVDKVEVLIIDDGSRDKTLEVARASGVQHTVVHASNRGLAAAYTSGLKKALELGADIIVNTDADNQYVGEDIARLVEPLLENRADIVIGTRPIQEIEHFSPLKKLLQAVGSWTVRRLSNTTIVDAPSGFRAVSREAAKRLFVYNRYTYTIETIIQAGLQNLRVESVPIRTNDPLRPSRLVRNMGDYVTRSVITMIRIYTIYRPLRFFLFLAALIGLPGLILFLRFLFLYATGHAGYIQSLTIGTAFLTISVFLCLVGVLADLISVNRRLLEEVRLQLFEMKEKGKK
jgi:glycosyltransferase involved in cell wall biosynthesis